MGRPTDLVQSTLDLLILPDHPARAEAWLGHRQTHPASL